MSKTATCGTSGSAARAVARSPRAPARCGAARAARARRSPRPTSSSISDRLDEARRRRGRRGARPRRRRPRTSSSDATALDASSSSTRWSLRLVEPALTTRIAPTLSTARSSRGRPGGPRRARASTRGAQPLRRPSPGGGARRSSASRGTRSITSIDEVEAVEVVEHDHVERRRGRALLLVAAHVEVVVVRAPVGEPVDQPRVAVIGEDDRPVGREQRVELASRTARADARVSGWSRIRSTTLTTRTFRSGSALAQDRRRGERLERRDVAGSTRARRRARRPRRSRPSPRCRCRACSARSRRPSRGS